MRLIHYTNLEGLHGIISSQSIRLTDARYLNDFTEVKEGISRLYSAMESLKFSTTTNSQLKRAYEIQQRELEEFDFYSSSSDPFFLCSFSRSPNRLSQWRSYGPVAIEFCAQSLKSDGFDIRECVYDDKEKDNLAIQHAAKLLTEIKKHVITGEYGLDYLDSVSKFMHLSTAFKNSGFHEELEVRHAEQVGEDYNGVKFKISGGMMKPYIEKAFSYESIKVVHLGPVVDKVLVRQSIDTLLNQVKRSKSANIEAEVEFIESEIPFRG